MYRTHRVPLVCFKAEYVGLQLIHQRRFIHKCNPEFEILAFASLIITVSYLENSARNVLCANFDMSSVVTSLVLTGFTHCYFTVNKRVILMNIMIIFLSFLNYKQSKMQSRPFI